MKLRAYATYGLALSLLMACGDDGDTTDDDGGGGDDASVVDGSTDGAGEGDAGEDASTGGPDGGDADAASDAATDALVDATSEASVDAEADAAADSGEEDSSAPNCGTNTCDPGAGEVCYDGECVTELNGCTLAGAEDLTGMATVTIEFGGVFGLNYAPKCALVSTGTAVTFAGSFTGHPLVGGVYDGGEIPGGTAPLDGSTTSGSSAEFTLSDAGAYPYYCDTHSAQGMVGAIFVE